MSIQNQSPFVGSYSYGPESERMQKQTGIKAFVNRIAVFLLKRAIFPGASRLKSKLVDEKRVAQSKEQLLAIGGESVKLKTPDGDILDGMYLNAGKFKEKLDKYFELQEKEEVVSGEKQIVQKLMLKKEYIDTDNPKINKQWNTNNYQPKDEVKKFYNQLKSLGFDSRFHFDGNDGFPCIKLPFLPRPDTHTNSSSSDLESDEMLKTSDSEPTALIAGGSGMPYSAYKGYAIQYLLRGINVMLVDFRGYGESRGTPSEHKLKLDLETAYQYLSKEKQVKNEDLLVHGHCLGGGPACDLAARRTGVNLLLDRGFAAYTDIAERRFPMIRNIVKKIFPSIVEFNNVANLPKVRGNIAIEVDTDDSVIMDDKEMKRRNKEMKERKDPELAEQHLKVLRHLPESGKGQIIKLMDSSIGHTNSWMSNVDTKAQFNRFLEQTKLFRRTLW